MQPSLSHEWARPVSEEAAMRLANQERRRQDHHQPDAGLLNGVRPELLSVMIVEEPLPTRTFIADHLVSLALALSLAVSVVTALTTLTITGELPGRQRTATTDETWATVRRVVVDQPSFVNTNMTRVAAKRKVTDRDVLAAQADQRKTLARNKRFFEAKLDRIDTGH